MHTRSDNTGRGHPSVLAIGLIALLVFSVFGLTMMRPQNVSAAEYDLTTDASGSLTATINGAVWERFTPSNSSGTGNFNTFLQVQHDGIERGYNTDHKKQFDEGSSGQFNRSFLLANVPFVQLTEGGTVYREFQLDINQVGSDPNWYLSLTQFQVWLTGDPALTDYNETARSFAAGTANLVYDLGANTIKMDYRANAGSGKRDYRVLVPQSLFDGKAGQYVVLFVHHGEVWPANDGFEEWGCRIPEVGMLSITKALSIPNGVLLSGIDTSFVVHVTGPSGTFDHTFVVADGVVQAPNPWILSNLTPGSYAITEDSYAPLWTTGIAPNPASVTVGGNTAVTVTNTYHPASLSVTKAVSIPEGVLLSAIDTTFNVHVTGPSGTFDHTFVVTDGVVVAPNPWTLTNLIPGSYTVTEDSYTPLWTTGIATSPAVLSAGDAGAVTVTNTYHPAKIIVDKVTKPAGDPQLFDFQPSWTDSFQLADLTTPFDSGWLIPGTYSVAEINIPAGWVLTGLSVNGTTLYTIDMNAMSASVTLAPGDVVTITFEDTAPMTTRTQGFWATHLELAHAVWFGGTWGTHDFAAVVNQTIGNHLIDTDAKLMSAFWSDIAKTSTGAKRSALDQARMQLLQQLVAAILNNNAFGSSPTGPISIQNARDAFAGTNITAIKNAMSAMAAFNESGDSGVFTPGISANAKGAKAAAALEPTFWDILP